MVLRYSHCNRECLEPSLECDLLCACKTAPYNFWKNPAKRVMSIVNLGLQCVVLMRDKMADEEE